MAEETQKKLTSYRVYEVVNDVDLTPVAEVEAANDVKAIAQVSASAEPGTSFMAIPLRNLKKRTITVVSEPKVVIA